MDSVFRDRSHARQLGSGPALAMAYVIPQTWNEVYDNSTAFCRGTIFPCLDKPFLGHEVRHGRK